MSKQRSCFVLLLVFVFLNLFHDFRLHAQLIPDDEVQTLGEIFSRLNNYYWNTSVDQYSCQLTGNALKMINSDPVDINYRSYSNVTCDCTFNSSTICHITEINLRNLRINADLPIDFADLAYLYRIDLTFNYFKGFIPRQWASLPLRFLSLGGNLVTGTIPKEIGNIHTLTYLSLQDNKMEGSIPIELGNLVNLLSIYLGGNDFTGVLPDTFGSLKKLIYLIDGVSFSGKIPEFIGNWTKLESLDMQGTSMDGPIPSTISLLTNLRELWISDLRASNISFPDLRNLIKLEKLVLRNCSITGPIPQYIGQNLTNIKNLDLSFNRLNGTIPDNLGSLGNLLFMYLTSNSLTGQVSQWLSNEKYNIDISYNNFTGSSQSNNCQENNLKMIAIYSSPEDKSIDWCFKKDLPCLTKPSQLFINCGGPRLYLQGKQYEQDLGEMGPSTFISDEKWACSTTGDFIGDVNADFKATSTTGKQDDIYSSARLAPVSLRYYGRCLTKGSYTVKLHFAEIVLTADQTNNTRGKRIFDIYIQGDKVLSDFNIAKEAGGIGKGIEKEYKTNVNGSTLEIHLYWSGKGTTLIPRKGVYGPLISAISVTPIEDFDPPAEKSVGAIVGIVVTSVVVAGLIILGVLRKKGYLGRKEMEDKELSGLELQTGYFTLRQIKAATGNFDISKKIGEGGFGSVYKGVLPDGSIIAVKQLSSKSKQGNHEFVNEIRMLSALQHPHLVRLFGCCIERKQRLLIYEYMENNSLARALFDHEEQNRVNLDWPTRLKICEGIARGLAYLHEESVPKIVHRDMKATNVLLDKDLNAKISDFGIAKLVEEKNTHVNTRPAGTVGYMAPEYATRGYLTEKADVFSFGIVAIEIVSGKSNTDYRPEEEFVYLLDWAYGLQEQGNLLKLVDPSLGTNYSEKEALEMLNIGLLCTNPSSPQRPKMSEVVILLEDHHLVQAPILVRASMT